MTQPGIFKVYPWGNYKWVQMTAALQGFISWSLHHRKTRVSYLLAQNLLEGKDNLSALCRSYLPLLCMFICIPRNDNYKAVMTQSRKDYWLMDNKFAELRQAADLHQRPIFQRRSCLYPSSPPYHFLSRIEEKQDWSGLQPISWIF